tara:strand:- start:307 stop:1140 length:834 start_codon:yes stop_codon:yes gene_type:complete
MKFLEFIFKTNSSSLNEIEIIISQLYVLDFDSFEETNKVLKAYISSDKYNNHLIKKINGNDILKKISFKINNLENKNWNNIWESNFKPVIFDDVIIRAPFHKVNKKLNIDIVINPKMSFGTGHHETTRLMLKSMSKLKFIPNKILDFGCGTGILSIFSEKKWNANILALDIDKWAYNNSIENIKYNSCKRIEVVNLDIGMLNSDNHFDLILANINTNTLINSMARIKKLLQQEGRLIISGFYFQDFEKINNKATRFGLSIINKFENNDWQCIVYRNS